MLQSDNESIINAKNESVVAKVTNADIKKISYSNYEVTKDMQSGNGYNGETLDQTGLIYLHARYYAPSVSRFVQIDDYYDREKQSVASQNKYVYTMNNPYKYVDRNGNWSLWGVICDFVDNVVKTVKKVVKKSTKALNNFVNFMTTPVSKLKPIKNNLTYGLNSENNTSDKGGGSKLSKPPVKKLR